MPRYPLLSLVVALACTPKPADTAGDGSGSGTEGAEETSATSGSTETEGSAGPTTVEPTSETTSAPTTAEPTGEPEASLPAACETLCAAMVACELAPGGSECVTTCADAEAPGSACAELLAAEWTCVAGLSCADLEHFVHVEPHLCLDQVAAYDEACAGG